MPSFHHSPNLDCFGDNILKYVLETLIQTAVIPKQLFLHDYELNRNSLQIQLMFQQQKIGKCTFHS